MKRPSLMDREFRSWPFVSTDPRMAEGEDTAYWMEAPARLDPRLCKCKQEFTLNELDSNQCAFCGKRLLS